MSARANEDGLLTLPGAKKLAMAALCKMSTRSEADLAFVDELTSCKRYGWVLFYNSRRFVETGNELEALGGNGPVVVLHDGTIHFLGSDRESDVTIAAFERERVTRGASRPKHTHAGEVSAKELQIADVGGVHQVPAQRRARHHNRVDDGCSLHVCNRLPGQPRGGVGERLDTDACDDVLAEVRTSPPPLGNDRRGDRDSQSGAQRCLSNLDDTLSIPLERNQGARVEGDARHRALGRRDLLPAGGASPRHSPTISS